MNDPNSYNSWKTVGANIAHQTLKQLQNKSRYEPVSVEYYFHFYHSNLKRTNVLLYLQAMGTAKEAYYEYLREHATPEEYLTIELYEVEDESSA